MAQRIAKKVLLLGWDAADWKVINPLLDAGKMPALHALIENGVMGNIATLNPPLSPILWTSIMTGKRPQKHGIRGFLEPCEQEPGVRPVSSTSRSCKALWNICHQSEMNTHAIGFWASHPAEPIRGISVSDQFLAGRPDDAGDTWPMPPDCVHPLSWRDRVAELRIHPHDISDEVLTKFVPRINEIDRSKDDRPNKLAEALARASSVQAVLMAVLESEPWDFVAAYFDTIDVVSHHFMAMHPPKMPGISTEEFDFYREVINNTYLFHDLMLANVLTNINDECAVLVVSDHGFHSDHLRPRRTVELQEGEKLVTQDSAWHRPMGILCAAGPNMKRDERIYGADLLDVTPLVLSLLGLPIGKDMDGKVLATAFDVPISIERIDSWDSLPGDAGQHAADKRQQPFDQAALLDHLVQLGYVEAPRDDVKKNADVAIRESNYNLGISYIDAGRPDEAVKLLEQVYHANPERARFATAYAQCLQQIGNHEAAAQIMEKLIAENGTTPDRDLFLGVVRFNMGRRDDGLKIIELLAEQSGDDPRVHVVLGQMYRDLQRPSDSVRSLRRAIELDESDPKAHDHLSEAHLALGEFEEAAEAALQAVSLMHFFPAAHMHLGMALAHMKEYQRAVGPLELAVRINPGLVEAHRYLASIHRKLNNWDLARTHRNFAQDLITASGSTKLSRK